MGFQPRSAPVTGMGTGRVASPRWQQTRTVHSSHRRAPAVPKAAATRSRGRAVRGCEMPARVRDLQPPVVAPKEPFPSRNVERLGWVWVYFSGAAGGQLLRSPALRPCGTRAVISYAALQKHLKTKSLDPPGQTSAGAGSRRGTLPPMCLLVRGRTSFAGARQAGGFAGAPQGTRNAARYWEPAGSQSSGCVSMGRGCRAGPPQPFGSSHKGAVPPTALTGGCSVVGGSFLARGAAGAFGPPASPLL